MLQTLLQKLLVTSKVQKIKSYISWIKNNHGMKQHVPVVDRQLHFYWNNNCSHYSTQWGPNIPGL